MRGSLVARLVLVTTVVIVSPASSFDGSGGSESLSGAGLAAIMLRWNGDIFWPPASENNEPVTRFGDEARAVFGPIPDADCGNANARVLPLEVDGNMVDLVPNPAKPGHPLEFQHRDFAGNVVKWTGRIEKCDKPSLAGTVAYCGLNSRLHRVVRGNVEWLFLCRKSNSSLEVASDPYWRRSDPRFALLGTIGFNKSTGEIVFFDGRKDRAEFDWSKPFVPPGGRSYTDAAARAEAAALYDTTFQIRCHACHDNKSPYVVDPHAGQSRVGYLLGESDDRALAFSLGDYLPERPRLEGTSFRIIGSGYTDRYQGDIARAMTVRDPTGNCTNCHTLTTQMTGRRLAADAVGREPFISNPRWGQVLVLRDEKLTLRRIDRHRTDWARRTGGGKIHPWMIPGSGNDLSATTPEIGGSDWRRLSTCLWGAGGAECGYKPLYTPCPAPESQEDGSLLSGATVEVLPQQTEANGGRILRLRWKYLNNYGGVPERDDIRFNIAVRQRALTTAAVPSLVNDYPSLDETQDTEATAFDTPIGISGSVMLIRNTSYSGHIRWTEPAPSTSPRFFELLLPAACNQRHLIRIVPKRFCFDRSNIAYSSKHHLLYADIRCRRE
ncbi:hypothetical protein NKI59_30430 [Mesorhizobium sp. M0598]|uniref:hypothetical protein n=1 Tax=Mesorhizobium sp. M0598 TaxID=2956968 RepID=UPI00333BF906